MKAVKLAFALLIICLAAVITNSLVLRSIITDLTERVESAEEENADVALREFEEIYRYYQKKLTYISLTVNHQDLTSIDESFTEIIGAAKAKDMDTLLTVKSRLIGALTHLKRLSGINIDSIF